MKFSNEAKVGIIGIVTIAVLIWGINYLKGRNILNGTYSLQAFYMNSGGLETSSPILMNGVKIGFVDEIVLQQDQAIPIKIVLSLEKAYPVRKGSTAVLASTDLLGTKAIRIDSPPLNDTSAQKGYMIDHETIPSAVEIDMISSLQQQIIPVMGRISDLAGSVDHMVQNLDSLLISQSTLDILKQISKISKSLSATLEPGGSLNQSFSNLESFTSMLNRQEDEISSFTRNLNSISEALDSAGLDRLSLEILSVAEQFNLMLKQVNSGEGTTGRLFYTDSLYMSLEQVINDLDSLIIDLNNNPGDYVHFSLFGGKSKEKK